VKEPTYLTIAGVTKGYWLADDPAVLKWKRDSEALEKLEGLIKDGLAQLSLMGVDAQEVQSLLLAIEPSEVKK